MTVKSLKISVMVSEHRQVNIIDSFVARRRVQGIMSKYNHCRTCECHRSPPSPKVKIGDLIKNRLSEVIGYVKQLQEPNGYWHHGGQPLVYDVETRTKYLGCWHYYDLLEQP